MKYVYLDQMKWIDLSRAVWGKAQGAVFERILKHADAMVKCSKVCFPLSSAHVIETNKSNKADQRERLAGVMIALSRGVVIRPSSFLVQAELARAMHVAFDKTPPATGITAFGRGIEDAFGENIARDLAISQERADRLKQVLDTPDGWMLFLASDDEFRLPSIESHRAIGKDAAERLNAALKASGPPDLEGYRRAYAVGLTMLFDQDLDRLLGKLGLGKGDFLGLGGERLLKFWQSVPCLDVEMELSVQRNLQRDRPAEPNDYIDISFLSVAIPYCDVVVTEKFWVDLARRRALDSKYETHIINDLHELETLIE